MIGIVTPYKTPNYGTKLQAYAMQQLFNKFDNAEIINFNTKNDFRFFSILGKLSPDVIISKIDNKKKIRRENKQFLELNSIRTKAIQTFDKDNYIFSPINKNSIDMSKNIKKYNTVVCGSDQLWFPRNICANWFNLSIVPENINKISFSASFGLEKIPKKHYKMYRRFLKRLDSIAVREQSGKTIVKEIANRDANITLDPTMMLDIEDWDKIANKSKYNYKEKYVFCYFLGNNEKHRQFATRLAQQEGYKLITMPHFKQWNNFEENFGDIQLFDVNPCDFVNLIKNAEIICTDSFHGTIFSLIYKRRIAVFERFKKTDIASTNSRIYSLLDTFDLKNMLVEEDTDVKSFIDEPYNTDRIQQIFETEKEKSFKYILNALHCEKGN